MIKELPITVGCRVKAALTSKHVGHIGIVVNNNGNFLTIEDTDKKNPLSYKSRLYPDKKVFQLNRELAIVLKE